MADQETMEQLSLFPTRDTTQEVFQEGLAQLPIDTPNDLAALLNLHYNTIINRMEQKRCGTSTTSEEA